MPKIKFTQNRTVQDELVGTEEETSYKVGQVVEVSEASALHWLNRGVAIMDDTPAVKPARARKKVAAKVAEESAD